MLRMKATDESCASTTHTRTVGNYDTIITVTVLCATRFSAGTWHMSNFTAQQIRKNIITEGHLSQLRKADLFATLKSICWKTSAECRHVGTPVIPFGGTLVTMNDRLIAANSHERLFVGGYHEGVLWCCGHVFRAKWRDVTYAHVDNIVSALSPNGGQCLQIDYNEEVIPLNNHENDFYQYRLTDSVVDFTDVNLMCKIKQLFWSQGDPSE
uniref:SET domain-containing protein n=1 Tax=Steinernema glaseri TaxID=37863 RepID=A0A1I7YQB3_9BILA